RALFSIVVDPTLDSLAFAQLSREREPNRLEKRRFAKPVGAVGIVRLAGNDGVGKRAEPGEFLFASEASPIREANAGDVSAHRTFSNTPSRYSVSALLSTLRAVFAMESTVSRTEWRPGCTWASGRRSKGAPARERGWTRTASAPPAWSRRTACSTSRSVAPAGGNNRTREPAGSPSGGSREARDTRERAGTATAVTGPSEAGTGDFVRGRRAIRL